MTVERFTRERSPRWQELEALVSEAKRRPRRLGAEGVQRLGSLYRAAAADLSLARRRFPGDPVVMRLEQSVGQSRHLVYDAATRRESVRDFARAGYWQSVRRCGVQIAIAAVLLFGSLAASGFWAYHDPGAAAQVAPGTYDAVTRQRPHGANLELSASTRAGLATAIFTNNIRVTVLAFAGGALAGIGTILLLLYNGLETGAVAGLAVESGNGRVFFELVLAHGLLELSCICVAGGAGIRLGWAMIAPGTRRRAVAVGQAGRESIKLVLGTAPWLVVAGLIEGFLTPAGTGLTTVLAVGVGAAALYWTLVLALGRVRAEPATSPAGTP